MFESSNVFWKHVDRKSYRPMIVFLAVIFILFLTISAANAASKKVTLTKPVTLRGKQKCNFMSVDYKVKAYDAVVNITTNDNNGICILIAQQIVEQLNDNRFYVSSSTKKRNKTKIILYLIYLLRQKKIAKIVILQR